MRPGDAQSCKLHTTFSSLSIDSIVSNLDRLTGSFDERELWFPCGLCKVGIDHVTDVNHVPSAECDKLL